MSSYCTIPNGVRDLCTCIFAYPATAILSDLDIPSCDDCDKLGHFCWEGGLDDLKSHTEYGGYPDELQDITLAEHNEFADNHNLVHGDELVLEVGNLVLSAQI